MSYARFGQDGSAVYVFGSTRGLECCGCLIAPPCAEHPEHTEGLRYITPEEGGGRFGSLVCAVCEGWPGYTEPFTDTESMIAHLREHQAAGQHVPDYVFTELWADDESNFPPNDTERQNP